MAAIGGLLPLDPLICRRKKTAKGTRPSQKSKRIVSAQPEFKSANGETLSLYFTRMGTRKERGDER
jgi:hypothetical protein